MGRGRPRLADDDRRSVDLRIPVTAEEKSLAERAAKSAGLAVAAWARLVLDRAARPPEAKVGADTETEPRGLGPVPRDLFEAAMRVLRSKKFGVWAWARGDAKRVACVRHKGEQFPHDTAARVVRWAAAFGVEGVSEMTSPATLSGELLEFLSPGRNLCTKTNGPGCDPEPPAERVPHST